MHRSCGISAPLTAEFPHHLLRNAHDMMRTRARTISGGNCARYAAEMRTIRFGIFYLYGFFDVDYMTPNLTLTLPGLGYFGQKTPVSKTGHKMAKNHENKKNNGTFTLTTLKVDGVRVVLFFLFSNV